MGMMRSFGMPNIPSACQFEAGPSKTSLDFALDSWLAAAVTEAATSDSDESLVECLDVGCNQPERAVAESGMKLRNDFAFGVRDFLRIHGEISASVRPSPSSRLSRGRLPPVDSIISLRRLSVMGSAPRANDDSRTPKQLHTPSAQMSSRQ